MKKLLNTLYVTTQGAYLSKEGETVLVRVDEETKLRLPIHTLSGIVCFGQVSCSPFLMGFCAERGVGITHLSEYGKFLARVEGPVRGNVLLRRAQYRHADTLETVQSVIRAVLIGKLNNSRNVINRLVRDHGEKIDTDAVSCASGRITQYLKRLEFERDEEVLRGIEGEAGRTYFSVFDHLITAQKECFSFAGRNRRPPRDAVNCLLSFVYTLLVHDVRSALETVGLDPCVGFLHKDRPGRPSLALDLMEEFRSFFADRLVLSLINLRQVKAKGFSVSGSGSMTMDDETRREVLMAYQKRKQEEIMHPFINEKVHIGILPHIQAQLFARFLRGDLDAYPVFTWK